MCGVEGHEPSDGDGDRVSAGAVELTARGLSRAAIMWLAVSTKAWTCVSRSCHSGSVKAGGGEAEGRLEGQGRAPAEKGLEGDATVPLHFRVHEVNTSGHEEKPGSLRDPLCGHRRSERGGLGAAEAERKSAGAVGAERESSGAIEAERESAAVEAERESAGAVEAERESAGAVEAERESAGAIEAERKTAGRCGGGERRPVWAQRYRDECS